MTRGVPILCVDFDGVLHRPVGSYRGPGQIDGVLVEGCLQFLVGASERFEIAVHSGRSQFVEGREAMEAWLSDRAVEQLGQDGADKLMSRVGFPEHKPLMSVGLDDRVIRFDGVYPSIEDLLAFRPWYVKTERFIRSAGSPRGSKVGGFLGGSRPGSMGVRR